jgi:hypothetical protein
VSTLKQPCCTQDEGRPLAAALQEEAANHLTLRGSRARVVSGEANGTTRSCQVRITKTSASEPLRRCRKRRDDVKTGASRYSRRSSGATCLLPERRPA